MGLATSFVRGRAFRVRDLSALARQLCNIAKLAHLGEWLTDKISGSATMRFDITSSNYSSCHIKPNQIYTFPELDL